MQTAIACNGYMLALEDEMRDILGPKLREELHPFSPGWRRRAGVRWKSAQGARHPCPARAASCGMEKPRTVPR